MSYIFVGKENRCLLIVWVTAEAWGHGMRKEMGKLNEGGLAAL